MIKYIIFIIQIYFNLLVEMEDEVGISISSRHLNISVIEYPAPKDLDYWLSFERFTLDLDYNYYYF